MPGFEKGRTLLEPRLLSIQIWERGTRRYLANWQGLIMARPRKVTALFAKARREQRRLGDWMRAQHDELLQQLGNGRIDWRAAMAVIADLELTDEHGQVPSRDTVARTWARVRLEVTGRQNRIAPLRGSVVRPDELVSGVRIVSSLAVLPANPLQTRTPLDIRPARPRLEGSSFARPTTPAPPAHDPRSKKKPDGSPPTQAAEEATERIQATLNSMAASRVPMPKRTS